MARYQVDDKIYDSDKATQSWKEEKKWDGRNMVSQATGSQWVHETLYLSPKGQYWVEVKSQWEGVGDSARLLSDKEAYLWLDANDHAIPDSLEILMDCIEG